MKIIDEFKQFAMRGNVVDMAVGIIIGGAFGKIVSSLVSDILMPPLGLMIGGVNFTDLKITIKQAAIDASGAMTPPVTINYGNLVQVIFDFLIVAFAIFMMIKLMNRLNRRKEEVPAAQATPPPTPEDITLLREIRDLLNKQK
ncbi:MAG: large-conductance mechanosensitive channel protein MscL [Bacteroidales bacterium]|nr:large-conductance mechanosensitive channel protein MscL [Bacteroidales bacterium]